MPARPPESFRAEPVVRAGTFRSTHANAVFVDPRIKAVLEAIRRECGAHLTASSIATRIGLSRSRFEHLLHLQTGRTFRAVLQEALLEKAATLLAETRLSVKEISFRCGYSSSQSFDRSFRKRFGRTPSAYHRSTYGYQMAHTVTK